jgi:ubiquinone biosynthesis protein COQ4
MAAPATQRLIEHSKRRGRDWRRAAEALRRLTANKEDTAQVYAVMHALNGNAYEVDYIRLLETPEGGRIAYERVELSERLKDEKFTSSFPPGSVGEAWRKFLETEHISVQGLVDESHKGIPPAELDEKHPYMWFFRRYRDIHDILHVLTGYGRDWLGELCLLAFSYQESHDLGRAVMAWGGILRARGPGAAQARKALFEARRRGNRAIWLPGEDFEKLLFEPLDEARRRLRLTPPVAYEAVAQERRDHLVDRPARHAV